MLNTLVPALFMLVCTESFNCDPDRNTKAMQMPDWETCFEAAKTASTSFPQDAQNQEFSVTIVCGSIEASSVE